MSFLCDVGGYLFLLFVVAFAVSPGFRNACRDALRAWLTKK